MALGDLRKEYDSLKKQVSELTSDIDEKRKDVKDEKELRVSSVRDAREEERAKAQKELQELRQKLTSEKSKEVASVREELRLKAKVELENLEEMKNRELAALQKKCQEAEKSRKLAEEEAAKIKSDLLSKKESEVKKLHRSLFEIQSSRDEMKAKVDTLSAENKEKTELIRKLKEDHEKELKRSTQESKQANKKQIEGMKDLQRKLSLKEKELVAISEKTSRLEMEKEQLDDKLHMIKEAEAWEKMSPRSSIQGEMFSPLGRKYSDHERDTLVRNSELSYLTRTLQEKNKILEEELNETRERLNAAELQNQPLHDKVEKLLKKIDHLTAAKSSFEKKVANLNSEVIDLKSSKEELEGEMERQKRNFQRQLNDSRTRSHSVTQMRSEMLGLQEKVSRLTTDNEKLKTTNQRRTKELGRLRKKLAKITKELTAYPVESQSESFEGNESDSISVESWDQPSVTEDTVDVQDRPDPEVDLYKEELEKRVQELQAEVEVLKDRVEEGERFQEQEVDQHKEELEKRVQELQAEVEVLKDRVKEGEGIQEQEVDQHKEELKKRVQELQAEVEVLKDRVEEGEGIQEQEVDQHKEELEKSVQELQAEVEGLKVRIKEGEKFEKKAKALQERNDKIEAFILDQDDVKKMMQHDYECQLEDIRKELFDLQQELELERSKNEEKGGEQAPSSENEEDAAQTQEIEVLKFENEQLQAHLDERDKKVKLLEHAVLLNRAQLRKVGAPEPSLNPPDPNDLTETIAQLEDSEQQLKEIYAELLDKPLYLAEENQRLEGELHHAKELQDELSTKVEELNAKVLDAEKEKDAADLELNQLQEWLDENQRAIFEQNNLKNELENAKNRIRDLEDMQEELLKQVEIESPLPPSADSKRHAFPQRSESVMKRKTGAKAIERSINVVETVQDTVLKLKEKILSFSKDKEVEDIDPESGEKRDQGTGPEEVVEMVQMSVETEVEAEIDVLTDLLQSELGNLNDLKQKVEEEEPIVRDPIEEQLRKVEEEKAALLAELSKMKGSEDVDDPSSSLSALPSEYETPASLHHRKLPEAGDEEYHHDYSEVELRHRESGVYEPVDFRGRKVDKHLPKVTSADESLIPGEESTTEMIQEVSKDPLEGWKPDADELQKELQELQKSLNEQRKEMEDFQHREDELKHQLSMMEPEKEELKRKVSELTEEEERLNSDIEAYQKQLSDYKQELDNLNQKLISTGEDQETLKHENRQLKSLLSEKEEELEDLTNVVPRLHKRMSQLEVEEDKWKNRYQRLEEKYLSDSTDGRREQDLEEEVQEWKERYETLSKKIDKDLLAKLQSRMSELQKVLEDKDHQIAMLHAKRVESAKRKRASRVFVALFDYDPPILCHTGQPDKELQFKEGDILEIVGDMDAAGFYRATLNGAMGLVPANFVEEVEISDPAARQRLYSQRLGSVDQDTRNVISPVSLVEDIMDEVNDVDGSPLQSPTDYAPSFKPLPPKQIKVEDKQGISTFLSWEPPKMSSSGLSHGKVVAGYHIVVNNGRELFAKGAGTSSVTLKGLEMKSLSKVKICTAASDGTKSDWVNVSVATQLPPLRAPLSPPPLSGSYGESSLYDSLKLGQSAMSPMNSFASNKLVQPESSCLYIASYDYDPDSTSPGASSSGELPLKAGTVVKTLEDVRDDGLVKAEVNGKIGLVPFSFLEKGDVSVNSASKPQLKSLQNGPSSSQLPWENTREMMAIYSYNPSVDSPNIDGDKELKFRKGQRITVFGEMDSSGFYMGASEGKQGLVPSNFVQDVTGSR